MSIEAMAIVLHHSKATGTEKLVLLGIANHYGDNGSWPSISTLAKYANVHPRNISRAISKLVESGELVSSQNAAPTSHYNKPNHYELLVSCPDSCDRSFNHKLDRDDTDSTPRDDTGSTTPLIQVASEPLKNRNLEPLNIRSKNERYEYSQEFSLFWNEYPRKTGKYPAQLAFINARKIATLDEILAGARQYAEDPNRSPTYTAEAERWLKKQRWLDAPLPERSADPEAAKLQAAEASKAKALTDKEHTAKMLEEWEQQQEALKANPVPRCQHDHIAAICRECHQ